MKLILLQVTHPGDGQGLVEVFPADHAEAPGGRTVQHHVHRHDPLTPPGRGSERQPRGSSRAQNYARDGDFRRVGAGAGDGTGLTPAPQE